MRKEILPEMFNYNKYPGPDFVYVADLLKSDACQFTVLENHKDALDATRFGQRFSEIMLKYDYICIPYLRTSQILFQPSHRL